MGFVEGRVWVGEFFMFFVFGFYGINGDVLLGFVVVIGEVFFVGGDLVRDGVGFLVGVLFERGVVGVVVGFEVRCDLGGEEGWGWWIY